MTKLNKQGLPDISGPKLNGQATNGKRKGPPRMYGVCHHRWQLVYDDFGTMAGWECEFCPAVR